MIYDESELIVSLPSVDDVVAYNMQCVVNTVALLNYLVELDRTSPTFIIVSFPVILSIGLLVIF